MKFNFNQNEIQADSTKEELLEVIKALGEVGTTAKKILIQLEKASEVKTELITLSKSPFAYNSEGYSFNSLYVGDSHVTDNLALVVTVDGLTYTMTLVAGENKINVPQGSELTINNTSGNGASLVLTRYNREK